MRRGPSSTTLTYNYFPYSALGLSARDRRQHRLGVGMPGRGIEPALLRDLDDLAGVQHRHPARHAAHHRQVVGDEHVAEAEAVLQVEQQRSEEHTSELQSLMRISYAVFCLKKTTNQTRTCYTT